MQRVICEEICILLKVTGNPYKIRGIGWRKENEAMHTDLNNFENNTNNYLQKSANNNKFILALHGIGDNASSFDKIAPLLVESGYTIVCPDLSSHGQSDHIPNMPSIIIYWSFEIMAIIDSLHWQKLSLFGHSLGSLILCNVAAIIPHKIEKNIIIDLQYWFCTPPGEVVSELNTFYNNITKFGRPFPLCSTEEECFKFHMKFYPDIQESTAKVMFQRSYKIIQVKDSNGKMVTKYIRSLSPYIIARAVLYSLSERERTEIHAQIKAPTLIFLSSSTLFEELKISRINELNCKYWLVNFEGSHHAHIEKPELFINEIIKFLEGKSPYNGENWVKARL